MPKYDYPTVKQAFFKKVLTIHHGGRSAAKAHRFVAWADRLDNEYSPDSRIRSVWNPSVEPEREYNLVLSLASNGDHYPLIDWDKPEKPGPEMTDLGVLKDPRTIWVRSGSGHWHGYINFLQTDLKVTTMLAGHPHIITDEKVERNPYEGHVKKIGYACLRPPWLPKGGLPGILAQHFPDALPEGFLDGVDVTPKQDAWEELFND